MDTSDKTSTFAKVRTAVADTAKSKASEFYAREKRYLRRNARIFAAIVAAAIVIPVVAGAPWWACLLIILCAIAIPPFIMYQMAKARYLGYINSTRAAATAITSFRLRDLLKH